MDKIERVRVFLNEHNPELKIMVLEEDTSTSFLAARALGTEVGQIAKTILFKTRDGQYFLIVAAGDARIDNKAVKELIGSRARMANAEEVEEITGFSVGGVCPFALQQAVPIFVDESLQRYETVYSAAGTSNAVLPVTYDEICRITGGSPCRVSITA